MKTLIGLSLVLLDVASYVAIVHLLKPQASVLLAAFFGICLWVFTSRAWRWAMS